jgi:Domain of unknown function (DUF4279)
MAITTDNLERASVTLLIDGDDLVPEEVTAMLGAEPEVGVRKGETFVSRGSPSLTVTASTGKWILGTGDRRPPSIDTQIMELLSGLAGDIKVWNEIHSRFNCYVTVGVYFDEDSWTGGIVLEADTLRLLADRRLAIDFDMYAPGASK